MKKKLILSEKYNICAEISRMGEDVLVAISGGDSPHTGSVSCAYPHNKLSHFLPEEAVKNVMSQKTDSGLCLSPTVAEDATKAVMVHQTSPGLLLRTTVEEVEEGEAKTVTPHQTGSGLCLSPTVAEDATKAVMVHQTAKNSEISIEKQESHGTFTFPGHKDNYISEPIAKYLANKLQTNVVVACGIHIDGITKEEIREIQGMVPEMEEKIFSACRS